MAMAFAEVQRTIAPALCETDRFLLLAYLWPTV